MRTRGTAVVLAEPGVGRGWYLHLRRHTGRRAILDLHGNSDHVAAQMVVPAACRLGCALPGAIISVQDSRGRQCSFVVGAGSDFDDGGTHERQDLEAEKRSLLGELRQLERASAVLHVPRPRSRPPSSACWCSSTPRLWYARRTVWFAARAGAAVGCRYHQRFLSEVPTPWEIVSILSPPFVFHPNINSAGALCLGHPPPAVRLQEIMHMTWAALVFNLRLADTVEWHGLNPQGGLAFVRANQHLAFR